MDRLRDNALIYGRLLRIDEPHLIERYNKALTAFGLPATRLDAFEIDRTGFSPQIAEELGDPDYLDPNGINRRFIILSPRQIELPVVHTAFSNTSQLMFEFLSRNARAIHAVTIRDVLYGEIEDSVSEVEDIEDLLSINEVQFKVLSGDDVLGKATELRALVDRLIGEPDAWRDDALLQRMVELARATGDIRANPLVPEQTVFHHHAYWTSHFGGLYVFVDADVTTVISDPAAPGFRRSRPWQVAYLSLHDAERIFAFLSESGRIELPGASWIEESGYLAHRTDVALKDLIGRSERDGAPQLDDPIWVQTWMHNHARLVQEDGTVPFLAAARRELARTGQIDLRDVAPERRFLLVRARPDHPDAWLVNRLISDFVPFDFVARYIFNKQGFYRDYQDYPPALKNHVVETLRKTYLQDKPGLRRKLYGLND